MAANFQLRIVTPEKILYSGDVVSLQAPGSEGSFGMLASHAPIRVALKTGSLDYVEDGDRRYLATSGGFVEVSGEGVSILAETAEFSDNIDVDRAEASRERSRQRLFDGSYDRARAEASLQRAINRLKVASGSA